MAAMSYRYNFQDTDINTHHRAACSPALRDPFSRPWECITVLDKQVCSQTELHSSSSLNPPPCSLSLDTPLTSPGLIWKNRKNITVFSGLLCKLNEGGNAQNVARHIVGGSYMLKIFIFPMVNGFILTCLLLSSMDNVM